MPRTPLLSHLVELAVGLAPRGRARHRRSRGARTPRRRRSASDEGLTRRDLLKRAALAGAGVDRPRPDGARPRARVRRAAARRSRGSRSSAPGISGMTAAMTLKDAGFRNVTVYEASDRVGGRTYTRSGDGFWEAGQWSEWGGELIDTGHELVFALCKRFGFDVIDLDTSDAEGLERHPLLRRRLLPVGSRWSTTGSTARSTRRSSATCARCPSTRGRSTTRPGRPTGIALDEHDRSTTGSRRASPAGTPRGSGSSSTSPT